MHIKKGDTVKILSGNDKGKTGTILRALPKKGQVIIEGINQKKKHQRARQQGKKGQMVTLSMPIDASNVAKTK